MNLATNTFMDENQPIFGSQDDPVGVGDELSAVNQIVNVMQALRPTSRAKVFRIVQTLFGLTHPPETQWVQGRSEPGSGITSLGTVEGTFSEDRSVSPKEFMIQKRPMQDVERIAALAYYLTHYRNTPTFKTIDLSSLNTEAAQIKFSNAAKAVSNAEQAGLLIPAARGTKQISAGGELFVQALPDRDAARAAIAQFRKRRKTRRGSGRTPGDEEFGGSDQ